MIAVTSECPCRHTDVEGCDEIGKIHRCDHVICEDCMSCTSDGHPWCVDCITNYYR